MKGALPYGLLMALLAGIAPIAAAARPAARDTTRLPPKTKLTELTAKASECKVLHPQRCEPLKTLVALGMPLVPHAVALVEAKDKPSRLVGLALLSELSVAAEGPRVLALVKDPEPDIQVAAITAVGQILPEGALTALSAALASEVVNVKIASAAALARTRSPGAIAPLLAAMQHFHPMVRATAARALGAIGDRRVVMDLAASLADGGLQRPARVAVVDALGMLGDPQGVPMVLLQLSFQDPSIRRASTRALARLKDDRAVAWLTPLLKDEGYAIDAAQALGKIGSADAVPALVRVVTERRLGAPVLKEAFWALGSIRSAATLPALLPMLREADAQIAAWAAEALGRIGHRDAGEGLLEALARDDKEIKAMVVYALEEISGKRFGEDAKAWAGWVYAPRED